MSDPGPVLGSGRRAKVFDLGAGRVFKQFDPVVPPESIVREAAAQSLAREAGLPVPRVHVVRSLGGRMGIEMDAAPGPTLADAMLQGHVPPEAGMRRMLHLHLAIHARPGTGAPPLHTRLGERIAASGLPEARQADLLAQLAARPEHSQLCHGDFHPFNILGPLGKEQVIDWADAASGTPLADACLTAVLIAPHDRALADQYLALYAATAGAPSAEIVAWMPIIAAARLSEAIAAERPTLLRLLDLPA